ncbi:hypothetical protein FEO94_08640 [Stenotrophomonas maltophilia]|nr:hypothetical protein FEO94_08640 [Stenotrophomonas maltophilia]
MGASAGLHPAPAVVPAAGRQPQRQRQKLVSCGTAGRGSRRGIRAVRMDPGYPTSPSNACNPGSHCLPGWRTSHRVR